MNFNTIGVIGKYIDPGVADTVRMLCRFLSERGREVLLDEETATLVPGHSYATGGRDDIGQRCDLAIVIGGDGTMLHAARSLAEHEVPLVGINLGHLGFLTDIPPTLMAESLELILAGDYTVEERALLRGTVYHKGEEIGAYDALNDLVMHKWDVARMIEIETYIDGRFVSMFRSDGLIVSTPTGSTAYALSAGGPLLHPTLDALLIVPICPHTMSNRPIVVAGSAHIEVVISDRLRDHARLTSDGQTSCALHAGDRIRIAKKNKPIRLIHPAQHDHYNLLRAKLRWAENPSP
ncbi:MAG: NAD(+) kinase [Chromatiales bacterium]|nr:NAD(+) kinase [Chromatiales bacterium]